MSYDDDSGLARDDVRDLVGDVSGDTDLEFLSDEEIDKELTRASDNVFLAASRCAGKIASRYAISTNFSIGGKSKSKGDIFLHFKQMEKDLKAQYTEARMGSFTAPSAAQIGVIRDSLASNYPPRQRMSDIQPEEFEDNTV